MNHNRREGNTARGTTIIEGLTTVGIISLVLTLTAAMFTQTVRHNEKTMTDMSAESQARIAITKVTNDLRQAMPPYGAAGLPITSPAMPQSGPATPQPSVTFTEADSLNAGNFTNPPFDSVTIGLDPVNHTITRTVNGGPLQVLEHDVTGFTVLPLNFDEYQVSVTVAPPHRAQVSSPPFTVVSSVFISYYRTNGSPGDL
jgi:type II secretory pathway component PulJ